MRRLFLIAPVLLICYLILSVSDFTRAKELHITSVRLNAKARAYAHYMRALLLENKNNLPGAIAEYRKAVIRDPDSAQIQQRLAVTYLKMGRTEEAIKALKNYLTKQPEDLIVLKGLADLYVLSNKNKEAIEVYKRIEAICPQDVIIKFKTGLFYSRIEDFRDRKSTRLNSSHIPLSRMPSSA